MSTKTYIFSIALAIVLIAGGLWELSNQERPAANASDLEALVLPASGVVLPVRWNNLGQQLTESGVLDREKIDGNRLREIDAMEKLQITRENAGFLLNLLWALGLGNENPILTQGPMQDPRYGSAGGFASTGGWTLARGSAMNHYAAHRFITLTADQQALVQSVAENIYRPCCNNPTHFPDCNHGMAMLGLLELMASQGVSEKEMYQTALTVNAYWFPDTYLTIAQYLASKGIAWEDTDPKTLLGAEYSSASGYQRILQEVRPPNQQGGGGSCGV